MKTIKTGVEKFFTCPEGNIFKDENDNVIKAQKIVLEKKKKEYPKTCKECYKELDIAIREMRDAFNENFDQILKFVRSCCNE